MTKLLSIGTGIALLLVASTALAGGGGGGPPAAGGGGSGPEPELFALAVFSLLPGVYFARKALAPSRGPSAE
jgi:hypothetical protein